MFFNIFPEWTRDTPEVTLLETTAAVAANDPVDGAGTVTLRCSKGPMEAAQ